jgi:hypothetical protein
VTIQPPPQPETVESGQPQLQPIPAGKFYRVASPVEESMVTPPLANELGKALEQFARSNGFSSERPLSILIQARNVGAASLRTRG